MFASLTIYVIVSLVLTALSHTQLNNVVSHFSLKFFEACI